MHIISDESLKREGYDYHPTSNGFVGYPKGLEPFINWKHIDGPLLHTIDGNLHWLTLWERFLFALGLTGIHQLNLKWMGRHGEM